MSMLPLCPAQQKQYLTRRQVTSRKLRQTNQTLLRYLNLIDKRNTLRGL